MHNIFIKINQKLWIFIRIIQISRLIVFSRYIYQLYLVLYGVLSDKLNNGSGFIQSQTILNVSYTYFYTFIKMVLTIMASLYKQKNIRFTRANKSLYELLFNTKV